MNSTAKKKKPAWMVKGSKAAKDRMRKLRAMQGKGKKKKTSKKSATSKAFSYQSSASGGRKLPFKKNPSLSGLLIVGGAALVITGIGADAYAELIGRMQTLADEVGLGLVISGTTILAVAVALKLAASMSRRFGKKYRGFLRGYGLRP